MGPIDHGTVRLDRAEDDDEMTEDSDAERASDQEPDQQAAREEDRDEDEPTPEMEAARYRIAQARGELGNTLEALREKLEPGRIAEQAKETVREATVGKMHDVVGDMVGGMVGGVVHRAQDVMGSVVGGRNYRGTSMIDTIKENPMPAALIALGVGWLYMSANRQRDGRHYQGDDSWRYGRSQVHYVGDAAGRPGNGGPMHTHPGGYSGGMQGGYSGGQGGQGGPGMMETARERVGDVAGTARDRVGDMAEGARDRVGDMAEGARERVGDVVDTTRERVGDMAGAVRGTVMGATSQVGERLGDVTGRVRDTAMQAGTQTREVTRRAADTVQRSMNENPVGVAAVALLVGAAVGMLMPATEQENRMLGETRDRLAEQAQQKAQQVASKAADVAQQVVGTAVDTAKDAARDQGLTGSGLRGSTGELGGTSSTLGDAQV